MKAHLGTSRRTLRGAFCVLISAVNLLYSINAAVLRWQCCTLLVLLVLLVSVAVTVYVYAAPQRLVNHLGTG